MSQQGEAAEQIANLAANLTVKGVECAANLAGKGAVSLATFLIAAVKDQKRTKGKVRMQYFNGKPTKVFVIRSEDFKRFAEEAKTNGILYAAAFNKKNTDGIINVVVHANDAARVNRIAETFAMSSEEIDKLREEILKSNARKAENKERERSSPPDEKTHTVNDETLADMMGEPAQRQTEHKQPSDIGEQVRNPMKKARMEKSNLSEPLFANSRDIAGDTDERSSVRAQIIEIKEERKRKVKQTNTLKRTKPRQTTHRQPERKKISKER